jgi:hypothetical protein
VLDSKNAILFPIDHLVSFGTTITGYGSGSGRGQPVNVDYGFPNLPFFLPPELFSSIV